MRQVSQKLKFLKNPSSDFLGLLICYSNMFYLTINKNPALYKFVQSSSGILSNYPGLLVL